MCERVSASVVSFVCGVSCSFFARMSASGSYVVVLVPRCHLSRCEGDGDHAVRFECVSGGLSNMVLLTHYCDILSIHIFSWENSKVAITFAFRKKIEIDE